MRSTVTVSVFVLRVVSTTVLTAGSKGPPARPRPANPNKATAMTDAKPITRILLVPITHLLVIISNTDVHLILLAGV
jgi:hypothetical protein